MVASLVMGDSATTPLFFHYWEEMLSDPAIIFDDALFWYAGDLGF
jgi:ubiquinone biosynthesis protein Coq4